MAYPSISEYIEAVKNAKDNFDKLSNLKPATDANGNPIMVNGNFAVVFKMQDGQTGKFYAVKCFLKEQSNRANRYRMIAEALKSDSSGFLTKFQYMDHELFVDSAHADGDKFAALLMDRVDGVNLDQYIRQHINDKYQLLLLAYQFSRLAIWLKHRRFSHGDLEPGNIMVREDGTLVLIDYDGMFVPAMKGQKAPEIGSPDFRHPARTEDTFNEHIDDFPLASILLSLRLIAEDPSLLERYGAAGRLLFSENDYRNVHSCQLLKYIFPAECAEVDALLKIFTTALSQSDLSKVRLHRLSLEKPKETEMEIFNTRISSDDEWRASPDGWGMAYSPDGIRFLGNNWEYYDEVPFDDLSSYSIAKGTKVICDVVFNLCTSLQKVNIPDSVISIGAAFEDCESLQEVNIPDSVISIGWDAFRGCKSLLEVNIPSSVTSIEGNPFCGCPAKIINHSKHFTVYRGNLYTSDRRKLISYLSQEKNFFIPDSVRSIGLDAISGCKSLEKVNIPKSMTSIRSNYSAVAMNL